MTEAFRTVLVSAVALLSFGLSPVSVQGSVPAADAENGNLWFV